MKKKVQTIEITPTWEETAPLTIDIIRNGLMDGDGDLDLIADYQGFTAADLDGDGDLDLI